MQRRGRREDKANFDFGARAAPAACREEKGPAASGARRAPLIILLRTSERERASSRAKSESVYESVRVRETVEIQSEATEKLPRLRERERDCGCQSTWWNE